MPYRYQKRRYSSRRRPKYTGVRGSGRRRLPRGVSARRANRTVLLKRKTQVYSKAQQSLNNHGLGLPPVLITRFKKNLYYALDTTGGANIQYADIVVNDAYKIDNNQPATQGRYYNSVLNINSYNLFKVFKVEYLIECANETSSDAQIVLTTGKNQTSYGSLSNMADEGEFRNAATRLCRGVGDPGDHQTFKGTLYPWKLFGITRNRYYADVDYEGAYATSPTKRCHLTLAVSDDVREAAGTNSIDVKFSLIYHVKCYLLRGRPS